MRARFSTPHKHASNYLLVFRFVFVRAFWLSLARERFSNFFSAMPECWKKMLLPRRERPQRVIHFHNMVVGVFSGRLALSFARLAHTQCRFLLLSLCAFRLVRLLTHRRVFSLPCWLRMAVSCPLAVIIVIVYAMRACVCAFLSHWPIAGHSSVKGPHRISGFTRPCLFSSRKAIYFSQKEMLLLVLYVIVFA